MNDTIGVIGLGTMGIGIAGHLLDEGCTVKGYDINPERLRILAEKGGIPASSPSQTAKDCSALVLMVFNGEQVMNVLFGENGAAESLKPGSCVIICASVGAPACEQGCREAGTHGHSSGRQPCTRHSPVLRNRNTLPDGGCIR